MHTPFSPPPAHPSIAASPTPEFTPPPFPASPPATPAGQSAGSARGRGLPLAVALIAVIAAVGLPIAALAGHAASAPIARRADVENVLAERRVDALLAESAPQQQVVNGWVARDLLEIQALQSEDRLAQAARTNDLLLLALALIAVSLLVAVAAAGSPATARSSME